MRSAGVRVLAAALCVAAAVAAVGCRQAAEKAVEEATGVKVEEDGGSVTVQTEQGEATVQSGKGLPEGFPSSVPVYDGEIETAGSVTQDDAQVYNVVVVTEDSIDQVKKFYQEKLPTKGWKITATMDMGTGADRSVTIGAETADLAMTVTVSARSDGQTEVMIGVGTKQ